MGRSILAVVGLLVAPAVVAVQLAQSERFEVASVKPQTTLLAGGVTTGTRYYVPGNTLRRVIEFAYDLPPVRVVGGPAWIDSDFWEIEARSPVPATHDEMRVMVRALLTERFELMTRVESRELPAYDLHVARRDGRLGPNATRAGECTPVGARSIESLREAGEMPCGPSMAVAVPDGRISHSLRGVTMSEFARYLERFIDNRVIRDRTDISGEFDIVLRYDRRVAVPPPATGGARLLSLEPPLPVALEEQLGLKLESTTALIDVLVIESAVRPMPN